MATISQVPRTRSNVSRPRDSRSLLFIDVPSAEMLSRFPGLQAVGIAGNSRSLTPVEMDKVIPDVLGALVKTGAPILHYKVCSTFDSSPTIGSFGRVMNLLGRRLGAAQSQSSWALRGSAATRCSAPCSPGTTSTAASIGLIATRP